MGLDMYMLMESEQQNDNEQINEEEIAYWRKHPDLHRLFEAEWLKLPENKGKDWHDFNGAYLKMTAEIIDNTMFRVLMSALPKNNGGFFFGESLNNKEEMQMDLEQLGRVKELVDEGKEVYYYSSF